MRRLTWDKFFTILVGHTNDKIGILHEDKMKYQSEYKIKPAPMAREPNYAFARNPEIEILLKDGAKARLACEVAGFALEIKEDLLIPTRGAPNSALARQIAMYLTHVGFGMSLHRVANAFGRDRSTIAHACHLIEDKRDDMAFDAFIDALEKSLSTVPEPMGFRN